MYELSKAIKEVYGTLQSVHLFVFDKSIYYLLNKRLGKKWTVFLNLKWVFLALESYIARVIFVFRRMTGIRVPMVMQSGSVCF